MRRQITSVALSAVLGIGALAAQADVPPTGLAALSGADWMQTARQDRHVPTAEEMTDGLMKYFSRPDVQRRFAAQYASQYGVNGAKADVIGEMVKTLFGDRNVVMRLAEVIVQMTTGDESPEEAFGISRSAAMAVITSLSDTGVLRLPPAELDDFFRIVTETRLTLPIDLYREVTVRQYNALGDERLVARINRHYRNLSDADFRKYFSAVIHAVRAEAADYPPRTALTDIQRDIAVKALLKQFAIQFDRLGIPEEDWMRILEAPENPAAASVQDLRTYETVILRAVSALRGDVRHWALVLSYGG
ncbi:hypothetical protein [Sutterella sp.]|uniref:hypothetical protein n=1 Tax=Sutterella sp. TaxID=1981025 RepID=UPI0026E0E025|nr:hypothetical protein [Sutterella sp.]MDO5532678.1 hypothetical protein [Sutterella sp.]